MPYPKFEREGPFLGGENVWEDDVCDRAAFSKRLRDLIAEQKDSCVIGLNGPWGSGKSYFLERFCEELRRNGKCCIAVNAWEHDWIDNPLLDLHQAVWQFIETGSPEGIFDADAKKMLSSIAWGIVKAVANHYTKGALDAVLKGVEKASDADVRNVLLKQLDLSRELKDNLSKIATAVYNKTDYPLVICVDELDRCRPTYTIELLERIKHFFDVENVVFVLGYDLMQLAASIRSVYGDIDAETYLSKFVTVDLRLSEISPVRLIDLFWKRYNFSSLLPGGTDDFCKILFQNLTKELHFSIRDMRKIFQTAQLGLSENSLPIVSILICILAVLKVKSPAMYARYVNVRGVHRYHVMAALFPRAMSGYESYDFKIADKFLREVASAIDVSLEEIFNFENILKEDEIAHRYGMGQWEGCEMMNHALVEMKSVLDNPDYDQEHCLVEVAAERLDLNAYWRASRQ